MFVRSVLWNSLGNFVKQFARAVQDFGCRALLPPVLMGVWELANLVRRVGSILELGFLTAAQRDLPVFRGKGDVAEEQAYRSTAFFAHLASKAIVALGVVGFVVLRRSRYSGLEEAAFVAAAVMLVLFAVVEALTAFYQSAERYAALSRATMVASVVTAAGALAATSIWSIWGLIVANVLGLTFNMALLARALRAEGVPIQRLWRTDLFRRLAAFAVPLRAADYPLGFLAELDLLFVSVVMGIGPLAIYGTAKMVFSQAVQVMSWAGLVVILRIYRQAGANVPRKQVGEELGRYLSLSYLVLLPTLACGVYAIAVPLIQRFLSAYAASVPVLHVALLTMFFVPQTALVRNLWILDKKILPLALSNVVGLLATVGAIGAAVLIVGRTLEAVAVGYFTGYFFYYVWIMSSVGREVLGARGALMIAGYALLACAYTSATLALVPLTPPPVSALKMVEGLVLRLAISGLVLSPLVAYGVWKSGLIPYAVSRLRLSGRQAAGDVR